MGIRKNCVAVNKQEKPLRDGLWAVVCGLLCFQQKMYPPTKVHRLVGRFRGTRGEAGESPGAFAAPGRLQPPAVRAVAGTEDDAFLWADIFD